MQCPRCDISCERRSIEGAEVDVCGRCRGYFLHRGELDKVAGPHAGDLEYSTLDEETFKHDDTHGPITCPDCDGGLMEKVEFIIDTKIILDYCKACGGFWLDGRELESIKAKVRDLNVPVEGPEPRMHWLLRFIRSLPQ